VRAAIAVARAGVPPVLAEATQSRCSSFAPSCHWRTLATGTELAVA
jgi:hypothetical protein